MSLTIPPPKSWPLWFGQRFFREKFFLGDLYILLMLGLVLSGMILSARRWTEALTPAIAINLSFEAIPLYAFYSLSRALIAYGFSLIFTLMAGYIAARSRTAERLILPLLDIGQSIPVLGFLPTLVLGLVALFPHSNLGLELACILMIFTGQVWNMTFGFYASLKGIPQNYMELGKLLRFSLWQRFWRLELPFGAHHLAWNSLMSMAGGWFFMTVCEAFTLSGRQFRLPGLGSFMAEATMRHDRGALILGFLAMVFLIVTMDFLVWRPIVSWTERFRVDGGEIQLMGKTWVEALLEKSRIADFLKHVFQGGASEPGHFTLEKNQKSALRGLRTLVDRIISHVPSEWFRWMVKVIMSFFLIVAVFKLIPFVYLLKSLSVADLQSIGYGTGMTLVRVLCAVLVATLWTVPFGIWVGLSARRVAIFQPLIQIAASFPAPMLYPLAISLLASMHLPFGMISTVLMLLGVQWYILFNILAGINTISSDLRDSFRLFKASRCQTWRLLYLPAVFPSLVTGWITAAGGAWNASIVAEFLEYDGAILQTNGLGALINKATAEGKFSLLAGSLTAMIFVVIILNETVWRKLYNVSTSRFRIEV
jgi:NitT/TauT family transport system permease protein